jgi:hypothetical protein
MRNLLGSLGCQEDSKWAKGWLCRSELKWQPGGGGPWDEETRLGRRPFGDAFEVLSRGRDSAGSSDP